MKVSAFGFLRPARRGASSVGALLLGSVIVASTASAQPGRSPEAEQACTPDVMRLCQEFIPEVPRIIACMKRKHHQLSPQCRVYMKPPARSKSRSRSG